MKRTLMISGALAAMLAVTACSERNEVVEDGPVENASAESGVGSNPVSNAAQDAASSAVGAASAVTAGRTTEGFVPAAAISDMYEIEAGRMASTMATNADLKKFGQQMVTDHTKMMGDVKAAVGSTVTPPTAMDERRQGMIDNLKQAGPRFDEVYREQQIAAHQEALTLHETYADAGDNAELKAVVVRHIPMIRNHLQMMQAMGGQGGGNAGAAADRSEQ